MKKNGTERVASGINSITPTSKSESVRLSRRYDGFAVHQVSFAETQICMVNVSPIQMKIDSVESKTKNKTKTVLPVINGTTS